MAKRSGESMKQLVGGIILGSFLFILALTAGYGVSRCRYVESKEIDATRYNLLRRIVVASPDKPILKSMLKKAFEDGKITEQEYWAIWDKYYELKIEQEKLMINRIVK